MLAKRLFFAKQEADVCATLIRKRIEIFQDYRNAKTVMCYLPLRGEVDTVDLIEQFIQEGKQVLLPVLLEGEIQPCVFTSFQQLQTGPFDVFEPIEKNLVSPEEIDFICVPGLAFNQGRYRLGYGGGYYDRFLPRLRANCFKVGLAYDFQIVDLMPVEAHDIKLDMIITENQFIGERQY